MVGALIQKSLMNGKSVLYRIIAVVFVLSAVSSVLPSVLFSAPARTSRVMLFQPDGMSFRAVLSGDEYVKVLTTEDGYPLVQDDDGFYCYAFYDTDGALRSTGNRVGTVPASRASSAAVPYDRLVAKAMSASGRSSRNRSPGPRFSVSTGTVRVPVLLAAFKDLPFTYTKEDFDALLNSPGYSVNGSAGSAKDYFRDQFSGRIEFQFDVSDNRTLDEVVKWLMDLGYIPSFCTACYREGRTGDRFMTLCKNNQILNCCHPNALMTLKEYLTDYARPETKAVGEALIEKELPRIPHDKVRKIAEEYIQEIEHGKRDFRF